MFVVCGEALWDLFGTDGPHGLSFDGRIGGSPFNVAVGLSRLGQKVALFTGISTDPLGVRLINALDLEGVKTGMVVSTDRPTTLSVVNLQPDGQPVYSFYGSDAADRSVTVEDLPMLGPDVWGIHAGSYSIAVEPVASAIRSLFSREKGRRLLTLDPNVRLNVEPDEKVWRNRIAELVKLADLVKVSDEDLGLLYPGSTVAEIAGNWRDAGAGLVVVTRGENGAEAFGSWGRTAIRGQTVAVVDTVGAGDTFQAALIAGLAEKGIWQRKDLDMLGESQVAGLVSFAIAASAITCSRRGADLPRRSQLPTLE